MAHKLHFIHNGEASRRVFFAKEAAMEYRMIREPEWQMFFDFVSRVSQGERVDVETIGLDIGDQPADDWSPLSRLSYDPSLDMLYLEAPPFHHTIPRPQEIVAAEEGISVRSISVRDGEGYLQIIHFQRPTLLETRGEGGLQVEETIAP